MEENFLGECDLRCNTETQLMLVVTDGLRLRSWVMSWMLSRAVGEDLVGWISHRTKRG